MKNLLLAGLLFFSASPSFAGIKSVMFDCNNKVDAHLALAIAEKGRKKLVSVIQGKKSTSFKADLSYYQIDGKGFVASITQQSKASVKYSKSNNVIEMEVNTRFAKYSTRFVLNFNLKKNTGSGIYKVYTYKIYTRKKLLRTKQYNCVLSALQ